MQNKFIKIESKGNIDPQAFVLLGASTKRDDESKIGFFGSGLKYSIAYLLRNNIEFKVFSEYQEIKFTTNTANFRDKSFSVIVIDGKETSMTTEMGIDWEAWYILREIYCNALDEGSANISIVDREECVPVEDKTVFYIAITTELKDVIANWELYFSTNRSDLFAYTDDIHFYTGGEDLLIYRRGVRCHYGKQLKAIFHYDISWVNINESRVIKDDFDFRWKLALSLKSIEDKKVISKILRSIIGTYEAELFWDSAINYFSNEWLSCVNGKILVPYDNAGFWSEEIKLNPSSYMILPNSLVRGLKGRFEDDIKVIGEGDGVKMGNMKMLTELSPKQQALLDDSKEFLKNAGYVIEHDIVVVRFAKADRLGLASENKIMLSDKIFDLGRKEIVATIIEENEHLITGYSDETRAFQNHFIMKYIGELENKTGKYL